MSEQTEGGVCYHKEVKQTYNQKYIMYNNMMKSDLVKMLIERDRYLEKELGAYQRYNVIIDIFFTDGSVKTYRDVLSSGIISDKKNPNQILEIEQSIGGNAVTVTIDMRHVKEYRIYDNTMAYSLFKDKDNPEEKNLKDMFLNKYTTAAIWFSFGYIMFAALH